MVDELEQMKRHRLRNGSMPTEVGGGSYHHPINNLKPPIRVAQQPGPHVSYEVIALYISPDLGERIMVSGERPLIDEIFPETSQAFSDSRSNVAWNQLDGRQIIRFPLNGYCKLNSIQVLTRLFNSGFTIMASTGGGVEGQQFSEYLLVRGGTI